MRLSFVLLAVTATLIACCDAAPESEQTKHAAMTSTDAALVINTRFLRSHQEGEERTPNLMRLDDLLANLEVAESKMLASLGKFDSDILKQIKHISGAEARIDRWKKADWSPMYVANMLKTKYPSLSMQGAEWNTWRLYAAQYLRQYHSLNRPCKRLCGPTSECLHLLLELAIYQDFQTVE